MNKQIIMGKNAFRNLIILALALLSSNLLSQSKTQLRETLKHHVGDNLILSDQQLVGTKIVRNDIWFRLLWYGKSVYTTEIVLTNSGNGLIIEYPVLDGKDDPNDYLAPEVIPNYKTQFLLPKIGDFLLKDSILKCGYFNHTHFEKPRIAHLNKDGLITIKYPELGGNMGKISLEIHINNNYRRDVWAWFPQAKMAYVIINLISISKTTVAKANKAAEIKLEDINKWTALWFRKYANFVEDNR